MFTSYSWNDYFIFTITILFAYYTFIAVRYYKWELLALAGVHRQTSGYKQLQAADLKHQFITNSTTEISAGNIAVTEQAFIAALKAEITALFANSPETTSSTLLSDSLNAVIRKYPPPSIQQRQDLSRFIYSEANTYFPGLLTENDVEQLWFG
ncbi:hypothetical protein [Lacibacter sp.]|uniref:hypothetical protein n=1 Tax=Lacibacter sp. TaxID=1915409 RepID=UPI002B4B70A0|nr:hypothetical protein [Lacibacter sp.]HLP37758.1 hypothetical protein [Lacibacter sp.]